MYTLKEKTIISSLNRLYKNVPEYIEKLQGNYNITSIVDGIINFEQGSDLDQIYERQLFFIKSGVNYGFNFVENTLIDAIECRNVKNQIHSSMLSFYNGNVDQFDHLYDMAISFIETYTRLPFTGRQIVTEYVIGDNRDRLLLPYKTVRDIRKIEYQNMISPSLHLYNVNISDIDMELARKRGIVQIRPYNINMSRIIERYFPKTRIGIELEIGYNEDEIPNDVLNAIQLLMTSELISTEIDGISSFSIDGYSESVASAEGKYSALIVNLKKQALSLLAKYVTGVSK